MEKLIEVVEIRISPGPVLGWLKKITILEEGEIIAEKLERQNFLLGSEPIPENTPALVIEVIEALAGIAWPFPPGPSMP